MRELTLVIFDVDFRTICGTHHVTLDRDLTNPITPADQDLLHELGVRHARVTYAQIAAAGGQPPRSCRIGVGLGHLADAEVIEQTPALILQAFGPAAVVLPRHVAQHLGPVPSIN